MNDVVLPNHRFCTIKELTAYGLSYYKIKQMAESGRLLRLNKQIYENTSWQGEYSDFETVAACAPKSVICMMSAARYYNLTTFLPDAVHIAVERDMKISTLPVQPPVHIWYYPKARYETGVTTGQDGACNFAVYDIEKTVVDILYYRYKIGIEETREVLRNYLAQKDKNLIKLHRYAETLGCKKILETYMEVLL